jgi:ABC-2 type transport system ATP-binding protein
MNSADWAVDAHDLSVQFGYFYAVRQISFQVRRGEIFGFLGANGAGKTTTIRVLCGLLIPTQGTVHVAGNDIYQDVNAIKATVGYMSQKFTLYNDLTVEENLNFIASLRKLKRSSYLKRRKELFDFISFDRPMNTFVRELPAGLKQQVSLAAALLHNPEVIFLDEPTAGVSPASRALFWSLIRQLAQNGKTVFVTTHYMDEAEQCERIALMRDGQIVALDTPEALKKSTFPLPMYEFDPLAKLNYDQILALEGEPVFSFFEPYGLRFHASVNDVAAFEGKRAEFEKLFQIRLIKPTLEDVFIQSVEAKRS